MRFKISLNLIIKLFFMVHIISGVGFPGITIPPRVDDGRSVCALAAHEGGNYGNGWG